MRGTSEEVSSRGPREPSRRLEETEGFVGNNKYWYLVTIMGPTELFHFWCGSRGPWLRNALNFLEKKEQKKNLTLVRKYWYEVPGTWYEVTGKTRTRTAAVPKGTYPLVRTAAVRTLSRTSLLYYEYLLVSFINGKMRHNCIYPHDSWRITHERTHTCWWRRDRGGERYLVQQEE